jgi:hypothetical protein
MARGLSCYRPSPGQFANMYVLISVEALFLFINDPPHANMGF